MNKKGFELSLNFVIMTILSIVMLVLSLTIARSMFSKASEMKQQIDEKTQAQIESYLSSGQRVAIPINKADIASTKQKTFGLGIINTLDGTKDFKILISNNLAINGVTSLEFLPESRDITLEVNKKFTQMITVRVPPATPSKTYVVDVEVTYKKDATTWEQYADKQKIYITVP